MDRRKRIARRTKRRRRKRWNAQKTCTGMLMKVSGRRRRKIEYEKKGIEGEHQVGQEEYK